MPETEAYPCYVYDPHHPEETSEAVAHWNGPRGLIEAAGVPARMRPGEPVTVRALTLSAGTAPIRVHLETPENVCVSWRDTADSGAGAMLRPAAGGPTDWEATFALADQQLARPRELKLRFLVERMVFKRPYWVASTGIAALLGVVAVVSLAWAIMGGSDAALAAGLFAAAGAAVLNPMVIRRAAQQRSWEWAMAPEPLGTLVVPMVRAEPVVRRSAAMQDPIIVKYCGQLAERMSQLTILGLASPIDLDEGFVPVTLRLRGKASLSLNVPQESFTDVDRLISSDIHLRRLLDAEAVTPEEAWAEHTRLTIVGDVGTGKTTVLQRLAVMLARGPVLWSAGMPIFLELHRVARREGLAERPLDSLQAAAVEAIVGEGAADPSDRERVESLVAQLIEAGELTLLLDGLDEVSAPPGEEHRLLDTLLAAVSRAALRWPSVRIVITCRSASMDRYRRLPDTFVVAETVPFGEDGVRHFVQHYFAETAERAARLLDELDRSPRIRALATTPLLLAFITLISEQRGSLPQRKTETYRRCTDLLLREWDISRGLDRHSRFLVEHKEEFLRRLAWELHSAGMRYVEHHDLHRRLRTFLPSVGLGSDRSADLLAEITSLHGLLRSYDSKWYGFVHFAIQEYFAAECIERRAPLQEAIEKRHRAWWQEVIRLYAGRGDCTHLVRTLLRQPEDLFQTNLRLAGESVAEGTAVDPILHEQLLSELQATVQRIRAPRLDVRFWEVLAQSGGPAVASLAWEGVANEELSIEARLAIVRQMRDWPPEVFVKEGLRRLRDEGLSTSVRVAIADLVGTMGEQAAWDELLLVIEDESVEEPVRRASAAVFGKIGRRELIAPLADVLHQRDVSTEVRREVAASLRGLGATGLGDQILDMLGDWHIEAPARSSLAAVVGQVAEERHFPRIVEALSNPHLPSAVGTSLAMSLKHVRSPALADALMDLVQDRDVGYSVRVAIGDALGTLVSQEHGADLRRISADRRTEEPIRQRLALALGAIGDREVAPALVGLLRDSSARPYLRLEAARILGMSADASIGSAMLDVLDAHGLDSFGHELAALVLGFRADPATAGALMDRLGDRSLPLPARLRLASALAALDADDLVGRMTSLLADPTYTAQLRGRVALSLTRMTDARDERTFERVVQLLPAAGDVPEVLTFAWHLSEQVGSPVYPADVGAPEVTYPWAQEEESAGGMERPAAETAP